MALNAYLKLTGQKQGPISGSAKQGDKEGRIAVIAITHEIVSPRDPASGLPTGKRMHKPFVITKEIDKSTPRLYAALARNEIMTEFVLQHWRANAAGQEVQHYTVKLTNATVASISSRMLNNKNPELTRYAEFEEITFVYEKIEWLWVEGGVTADDDWERPAS